MCFLINWSEGIRGGAPANLVSSCPLSAASVFTTDPRRNGLGHHDKRQGGLCEMDLPLSQLCGKILPRQRRRPSIMAALSLPSPDATCVRSDRHVHAVLQGLQSCPHISALSQPSGRSNVRLLAHVGQWTLHSPWELAEPRINMRAVVSARGTYTTQSPVPEMSPRRSADHDKLLNRHAWTCGETHAAHAFLGPCHLLARCTGTYWHQYRVNTSFCSKRTVAPTTLQH